MIADAFGAKLGRLPQKEQGILNIEVIEPDQIFLGIPNSQVFDNHHWAVRKLGHELIALARSKDGIEVIKHRAKLIYGVQFHPEMFIEQTCGNEILRNFLHLVSG